MEKKAKELALKEDRNTLRSYQGDGETQHSSFAVHKQNALFIPGVQVEVVVHAKGAHMLQGVMSVLQLNLLHSCRGQWKAHS